MTLSATSIASPVGVLLGTFDGDELIRLDFEPGVSASQAEPAPSSLVRPLRAFFDQYFAGLAIEPGITMAPSGTAFQQAVWAALRDVPWGETRSYAEVARAIKRPEAVRAVAQAVGRNPIAILIPCHRVIGSTCTLTGYAGGLARKRALLELEGALVAGTHARTRVSSRAQQAQLLGAGV